MERRDGQVRGGGDPPLYGATIKLPSRPKLRTIGMNKSVLSLSAGFRRQAEFSTGSTARDHCMTSLFLNPSTAAPRK